MLKEFVQSDGDRHPLIPGCTRPAKRKCRYDRGTTNVPRPIVRQIDRKGPGAYSGRRIDVERVGGGVGILEDSEHREGDHSDFCELFQSHMFGGHCKLHTRAAGLFERVAPTTYGSAATRLDANAGISTCRRIAKNGGKRIRSKSHKVN